MVTDLATTPCDTLPLVQCFSYSTNPLQGITPGYGPKYEGVPFISLAGGFSVGNNANGNFSQTGNVYHGFDSVSKIVGSHSLKFGVGLRNQRFHHTYFFNINCNYQFSGGVSDDVGFADFVQ